MSPKFKIAAAAYACSAVAVASQKFKIATAAYACSAVAVVKVLKEVACRMSLKSCRKAHAAYRWRADARRKSHVAKELPQGAVTVAMLLLESRCWCLRLRQRCCCYIAKHSAAAQMLLRLTLTLMGAAVTVAVIAVADMTVMLQRLTAECCWQCCNADAATANAKWCCSAGAAAADAELLSRRHCCCRWRLNCRRQLNAASRWSWTLPHRHKTKRASCRSAAAAAAPLSLKPRCRWSCKPHCQHKPRVSAVLLLELTLLRRHKHMTLRMKAPQGTVCMSLMLVADVAVAHARSAVAESCPAGESCMLLMLEADADAEYARSAVADVREVVAAA